MAPATCKVLLKPIPDKKVRAGKSRLRLARDFDVNAKGSMVLQDITTMMLRTTECAIKEQEKLDNPPTHILVNGKPVNVIRVGGPKQTLIYKTRTVFSASAQIKEAATEAYRKLREVTRRKTGFAARSDHFLVFLGTTGKDTVGKYLGAGGAGIQAIPENLTPRQNVSIVGPVVPYGRHLYWNPAARTSGKNKGKQAKRNKFIGGDNKLRKLLGISIRIKGATLPMHVDVKRRMNRIQKFKGLSFVDPFYMISPRRIDVRAGDKSGATKMKRPLRMPAITVQVKRAGRIL